MLMERSSPVQRLIIAIAGGRAADARSIVARDPSLLAKMTPEDHGALPTAAWREDEAATLLMLDLGFDPLARGPDGGTALHAAAWRGLTTLVERILAHPRVTPILGTLIAFTDTAHGSTPLGWCCHGSKHCHNPAGDYPRIARALVAAGAVPGPNLDDATPEVRKALAR
jgi:ankyrin repeat protein